MDSEAARFFYAFQNCDRSDPGEHEYLFSGHDLERWLLKTMATMVFSDNFAHEGGRIRAKLPPSLNLARQLEDPSEWPVGAGLYASARVGDGFARLDQISIAPLVREIDETVAGLYVEVLGLKFDFFPRPPTEFGLNLPISQYRLGKIEVSNGRARHILNISWEDGHRHGRLEIAALPVR